MHVDGGIVPHRPLCGIYMYINYDMSLVDLLQRLEGLSEPMCSNEAQQIYPCKTDPYTFIVKQHPQLAAHELAILSVSVCQ